MPLLSFRLLAARLVVLGLGTLAGSGMADAGWRDDIGTFRIGLVAEAGGNRTVAGLSTLKQAYSRALGMPVEIFVARDYAALIDAQASARVEYAAMSAMAYAASWQLCNCVEPVAAPVGADGSIGLRAVVVGRLGALNSVDDIPAHRVAIAGGDGNAVRALVVGRLAVAGSVVTGSEPFFMPARDATEAEAMFASGTVDAIVGWVPAGPDGELAGGTLSRLESLGIPGSELAVIWKSQLLRHGPHTLRAGLDPEVGAVLRAFLVGLKELSPDVYDLLERHHAGGFATVTAQDYSAAVEIVQALAAVQEAE